MTHGWYDILNVYELDSPALVLYQDRIMHNITAMIDRAGAPDLLIPHIKTAKIPQVVALYQAQGVSMFKCATIAEAEMLLMTGAQTVIIAHQLVGPKIERLIALCHAYPHAFIATLVDCRDIASVLQSRFALQAMTINVFVDVNSGMNRSGHPLNEDFVELYKYLHTLPNLQVQGLHVYDGHIRDTDFSLRTEHILADFAHVDAMLNRLNEEGFPVPMIIAGGTPAFSTHAHRAQDSTQFFCSPGTAVFWDWGYGDKLCEQNYLHAAIVLGRIISKPAPNLITLDIGHKAISSENPLDKRMRILNWDDAGIHYALHSHSEEHSVIELTDNDAWQHMHVGDIVYALPYHVCPTVNLYDEAYIVEQGMVSDVWNVLARKRRITI